MAPKPIRIGFIGLSTQGWASDTLAPPLFQSPVSSKYALVAVSTTNPKSAAASAQKYTEIKRAAGTDDEAEVKAYHGSTSQIACDPDVDIVAVSVGSTFQKEAALRVIEAGKDVFVEWPVGRDLSETQELVDAAKRTGTRSLVGLQMRLCGYVQKIKEIIDSGKIGKIISTSFVDSYPREFPMWGPRVFSSRVYTLAASNGASLFEAGAGHTIDTLTYLFGAVDFPSISTGLFVNQYPNAQLVDPVTNEPTGETRPQETPHQIAFSGSFAAGAVFNVHIRAALPTGATRLWWVIDGEKGSLRIEDNMPFIMSSNPQVFLSGEKVEIEEEPPLQKASRAWEDFANAGKSHATLEDALATKKILEAVKKSAVPRTIPVDV
ncbi:dimeric dihydrodiol [Moniliophthora roreri MCA 2997]|uniref:Dimeric dihydrodiol n=2 Tax=Moniliophthora roreri TaxID=221103 RepID=V2Y2F1_MONRO|nr:dimeric dihydrodiol [Moniliophthora roreri MCA 2997]